MPLSANRHLPGCFERSRKIFSKDSLEAISINIETVSGYRQVQLLLTLWGWGRAVVAVGTKTDFWAFLLEVGGKNDQIPSLSSNVCSSDGEMRK